MSIILPSKGLFSCNFFCNNSYSFFGYSLNVFIKLSIFSFNFILLKILTTTSLDSKIINTGIRIVNVNKYSLKLLESSVNTSSVNTDNKKRKVRIIIMDTIKRNKTASDKYNIPQIEILIKNKNVSKSDNE